MKLIRVLSLSVLAATSFLTFSELNAQSLARDKGPAEVPPSSFKGNQYVDSKGCVYIRAGVDGNTTWVPRVSRSRKVVCGAQPSLGATAVATAPKAAPQRPVQITNPAGPSPAAAPARAAAAPAATQPAPVRRTVTRTAAPKSPAASQRVVRRVPAAAPSALPQVRRVNIAQPRGVAAPAPRRVAAPAPRRVVAPAPQRRVVRTVQAPQPQVRQHAKPVCAGASAISSQYLGRSGLTPRCGPQADWPAPRRTGRKTTYRMLNGQEVSPSTLSPNAVIMPRHVYQNKQASRLTQPMPKGYRAAWDDDRLNPNRAQKTLRGKQQTDLIWTRTVPRRLIVARTGQDVTHLYPQMQPPAGHVVQEIVEERVVTQRVVTRKVVRQSAQPVQRHRVSTRGTAPRKPAVAAAPQRQVKQAAAPAARSAKSFVHIAAYTKPADAQRAASNIKRLGLPVRLGTMKRQGQSLRVVLAGPFASSDQSRRAVGKLHRAGYTHAFVRK